MLILLLIETALSQNCEMIGFISAIESHSLIEANWITLDSTKAAIIERGKKNVDVAENTPICMGDMITTDDSIRLKIRIDEPGKTNKEKEYIIIYEDTQFVFDYFWKLEVLTGKIFVSMHRSHHPKIGYLLTANEGTSYFLYNNGMDIVNGSIRVQEEENGPIYRLMSHDSFSPKVQSDMLLEPKTYSFGFDIINSIYLPYDIYYRPGLGTWLDFRIDGFLWGTIGIRATTTIENFHTRVASDLGLSFAFNKGFWGGFAFRGEFGHRFDAYTDIVENEETGDNQENSIIFHPQFVLSLKKVLTLDTHNMTIGTKFALGGHEPILYEDINNNDPYHYYQSKAIELSFGWSI